MGFGTRVFVLLFVCVLAFGSACYANTCLDATGCYGPGIGSDGLANTVVGGPSGNLVSYRFRAGHSGSLQQIHVYLMQSHSGYSAGTGGQLQVTVNADDGTAAHNPSSTVLATYLLSKPLSATPSIYFPVFVFTAPPSLVAGQLYHILFKNVDPNPATNYLSVNALYYENPSVPAQPTISDVDGAVLLGGPGGTWAPRQGYLPILELDYQDGFSEWNGYMEVWVGAPQNISGTAAVRETITVSGTSKNVASATVRRRTAQRVGPSDRALGEKRWHADRTRRNTRGLHSADQSGLLHVGNIHVFIGAHLIAGAILPSRIRSGIQLHVPGVPDPQRSRLRLPEHNVLPGWLCAVQPNRDMGGLDAVGRDQSNRR